MKKQTYYINVHKQFDPRGKQEVEAYKIDIDGCPFLLHKNECLWWRVSEFHSGLLVREGKTRREAIALATEALRRSRASTTPLRDHISKLSKGAPVINYEEEHGETGQKRDKQDK